jgi:nucleolar MIF4G domain-containing protein 1
VSDANSTFSNQTNVRATFMLANLSDLKNNRKKIETSDLDRLKKLVMSISKNNLLFNEPLQVSLDDILSIETRGRWWVVGASYKQAEVPKMDEKTDLHQLAVKQKMNTDVRKSIFMVLLSSQDYIDATNQILKLGLRKGQQKEIIKVLIHCVQQESTYNYFYTLVVAQFIEYDPEFAYTYQFCLWDTYKLLDDLKKAAKLAQMTSDLIVDSKLPFGALKGLEINVPTKAQKRFLVILTVNVLKKFDLNIFSRISGMIDFRDSYLTFLEQNKPVFANLVGAKELLNFKTLCKLLDNSS